MSCCARVSVPIHHYTPFAKCPLFKSTQREELPRSICTSELLLTPETFFSRHAQTASVSSLNLVLQFWVVEHQIDSFLENRALIFFFSLSELEQSFHVLLAGGRQTPVVTARRARHSLRYLLYTTPTRASTSEHAPYGNWTINCR